MDEELSSYIKLCNSYVAYIGSYDTRSTSTPKPIAGKFHFCLQLRSNAGSQCIACYLREYQDDAHASFGATPTVYGAPR